MAKLKWEAGAIVVIDTRNTTEAEELGARIEKAFGVETDIYEYETEKGAIVVIDTRNTTEAEELGARIEKAFGVETDIFEYKKKEKAYTKK